MDKLKSQDLLETAAYLRMRKEGRKPHGAWLVELVEWLQLAWIFGGGWLLMRHFGCWPALLIVGLGYFPLKALEEALRQRRPTSNEVIAEMVELSAEGNLARRMHPDIGLALEECAREAMEICRILDSHVIKDRGAAWAEVVQSAREAIDRTMDEVLHAAAIGYRRRNMRRATFEKVTSDQQRMSQVVENMANLRNHLVRLRTALGGEALSPTQQLESTLARIEELKNAEKELEDYLRLGQAPS